MERYEMRAVIRAVQERQGLRSEPAVARFLGVTEKTVANWKHGRNFPDVRLCHQLAEAAGLDPDILIAYNSALRAPTEAERDCWQRIVRRLLQTGETAIFAAGPAIFSIAATAATMRV